MSLFRWSWLRRFVRRRTNYMNEQTAGYWKSRLSYAYAFFAWNAFGFVCYAVYSGKADWAEYHGLKSEEELALSPAQQWAKTLQLKNATVYKINGFGLIKTTEIDEDGNMIFVSDKNTVENTSDNEELFD